MKRTLLHLILLGVSLFPSNSIAQEVVLEAKTGDVRIEGKLVEFDGEFYRVETDFGVLTVDGRTVDCTGEACPTASDLTSKFTVSGSGDLARVLLPTLIEAFGLSLGGEANATTEADLTKLTIVDAADTTVAEIQVVQQPDLLSFADLSKEGMLIAAASRLPSKEEAKLISDAELGNPTDQQQHRILALDGVVAAVSPANPVKSISINDLRNVIRGEITNWKAIGGPDAEINLYLPPKETSFDQNVKASELNLVLADAGADAVFADGLADAADAATIDPFGIALTSFSAIRNARALALHGPCGIYTKPTEFNLKSGAYPMTYKHYLFFPKVRLPVFAREFLDFVGTTQAQNVIASLGFADLGISALPLDHQGQRLANTIMSLGSDLPVEEAKKLTDTLNGAERLSTTFRFEAGSKGLDRQSQQNAELLAAGLILGNYADKQVHIIGFSDSEGGFAQNKKLSRQRADTVRKALVAKAPDGSLDEVDFHVSGFGEASPLACEDGGAGKTTNRRVEIWIKDRN